MKKLGGTGESLSQETKTEITKATETIDKIPLTTIGIQMIAFNNIVVRFFQDSNSCTATLSAIGTASVDIASSMATSTIAPSDASSESEVLAIAPGCNGSSHGCGCGCGCGYGWLWLWLAVAVAADTCGCGFGRKPEFSDPGAWVGKLLDGTV